MRLVAALVCLLAAGAALADKVPTPPNGYAYWGIHSGAPWYDSNAQAEITSDEAAVGRKFDVDRIYNIFNEQFPFEYHRWTATQGRIPFISLQPFVFNSSGKDVTAGGWDAYLTTVGNNLKNWPQRIFFTFHHEPDLSFCPNNISPCDFTKYYGSSSEYVAAYTHLRNLWNGLGVVNCTYVTVWTEIYWNSNVSLASSFFPGSSVVDWLGLDAYNFISASNSLQFVTCSRQWLLLVGKHTAEYGCKEYRLDLANAATWLNNSKPDWYTNIGTDWPNYYPNIKAFLQFDVQNTQRDDWRFNTSLVSQCSFATLGLTAPLNWWNSGAQTAHIPGSLPAICRPTTAPPSPTSQPTSPPGPVTVSVTVAGGGVTGATVTGTVVTGGAVTGATLSGGSLTGGAITGAVVTANSITGASITGAVVTGGSLNGGSLTGAGITGAIITATDITGGSVTGGSVTSTVAGSPAVGGGTTASSRKGSGGLSGGAIAGIVIGVIAAVFIAVLLVIYFAVLRRRLRED